MEEQVRHALGNLIAVLAAADMGPENVVKITIFTTDVDALLPAYRAQALALFASTQPSASLLGVTRLAYPEMKVEIEAIAVA